jgi:hypothetical protein
MAIQNAVVMDVYLGKNIPERGVWEQGEGYRIKRSAYGTKKVRGMNWFLRQSVVLFDYVGRTSEEPRRYRGGPVVRITGVSGGGGGEYSIWFTKGNNREEGAWFVDVWVSELKREGGKNWGTLRMKHRSYHSGAGGVAGVDLGGGKGFRAVAIRGVGGDGYPSACWSRVDIKVG